MLTFAVLTARRSGCLVLLLISRVHLHLDDDRVVQQDIDHIRSCECIDLPARTATSFDDVVPTPIEDNATEGCHYSAEQNGTECSVPLLSGTE